MTLDITIPLVLRYARPNKRYRIKEILLYSHLISMLGTPGQLLESRQVSERKIICEALTCVIRQIKYDYNPNRRGALARFIEKASPSELHKGKSRQILNTKKASLKPDAKHPKPRLAVLCGGEGGLIVPQHPAADHVTDPTTGPATEPVKKSRFPLDPPLTDA